jgi:DNA-binding transcriptional ArsR family regulator
LHRINLNIASTFLAETLERARLKDQEDMRHISYAEERAILVRMLIAFHRSIARDYPQIGDWTTLQIGMLIFYHDVEGHRPPTASKLARELGVPRPTVVRHLQRLVRLGALCREGTGYSVPEGVINTPDAERGAFNRIKIVLRAAKELSEIGHPKSPSYGQQAPRSLSHTTSKITQRDRGVGGA